MNTIATTFTSSNTFARTGSGSSAARSHHRAQGPPPPSRACVPSPARHLARRAPVTSRRATTGRWSDVSTPLTDVYTSAPSGHVTAPHPAVRHMTRSVHDGTRCFLDVSYVFAVPRSATCASAGTRFPLRPPRERSPGAPLDPQLVVRAHHVQHSALQQDVHRAAVALDAVVQVPEEHAHVETVRGAPTSPLNTPPNFGVDGVGRAESMGESPGTSSANAGAGATAFFFTFPGTSAHHPRMAAPPCARGVDESFNFSVVAVLSLRHGYSACAARCAEKHILAPAYSNDTPTAPLPRVAHTRQTARAGRPAP